jgi:hypothetical protein
MAGRKKDIKQYISQTVTLKFRLKQWGNLMLSFKKFRLCRFSSYSRRPLWSSDRCGGRMMSHPATPGYARNGHIEQVIRDEANEGLKKTVPRGQI